MNIETKYLLLFFLVHIIIAVKFKMVFILIAAIRKDRQNHFRYKIYYLAYSSGTNVKVVIFKRS